jgi:hypothetical protein
MDAYLYCDWWTVGLPLPLVSCYRVVDFSRIGDSYQNTGSRHLPSSEIPTVEESSLEGKNRGLLETDQVKLARLEVQRSLDCPEPFADLAAEQDRTYPNEGGMDERRWPETNWFMVFTRHGTLWRKNCRFARQFGS